MKFTILIPALFALAAVDLSASESADSDLHATLAERDRTLFEESFNQCNTEVLKDLVSEDLEFYHDTGGVVRSAEAFAESFRNGVCKLDYTARRELVPDSLETFPLKKDGELYGAIQRGMHRFYALRDGQAPELTSTARFTHLWLLRDGNWKLHRVLSYDHRSP